MKFEISKKTIIIVVSSIVGIILLGIIIGFVTHARYERNDFGRDFRSPDYSTNFAQGNNFARGNGATMMSGIENIIATSDYASFQSLFSGTRMVQEISTPEKFAIRVELQNTLKKVQDLQDQLGSGNNGYFGPMMIENQQGRGPRGENERGNSRGNMMREK